MILFSSPAPPSTKWPEIWPRFDLPLCPLLKPGLVCERGVHVHAVEAPRHHGKQEDHSSQDAREPKRVVA
jgi:hypothetical protein